MCGIVAVVRRPSERTPPVLAELAAGVEAALGHLDAAREVDAGAVHPVLEAAAHLERVDAALRGVPGVTALVADAEGASTLAGLLVAAQDRIAAIETTLDADGTEVAPDGLEDLNAALVRTKDALWAIRRDRLRAGREVGALAGTVPTAAALAAFTSVQSALSSLDRLEVRGRDSAGLHLFVSDHALDVDDAATVADIAARAADPLFRSGSVRVTAGGSLCFVYKAAAEIGELGDNVAALRAAITADDLLHRALAGDRARTVVLGHTRWASVGIISEANAHPLNQEAASDQQTPPASGGHYVAAALNGDVDNFGDLVAEHGLAFAPEITTDAKVIPALVAGALAGGEPPLDAFRDTVAALEGSVAVAAHAADDPDRLLLALRGSGQALYVGVADDVFVVASEPYGLVEETTTYLRLDGETPGNPDNPGGSRGQIVVLDSARAGDVAGIRRLAYDGTELPVDAGELVRAQITTRDIDRGDFPHFLLKEMFEAPSSFRKTLRGKIVDVDGRATVDLGQEALPDAVRERLRSGTIRRVLVVGQGTAAVAGQSAAAALRAALGAATPLLVEAVLATELSGFRLAPSMDDTLVVAISQSGTTTDTNRTVDLARSRGAAVVAIVNRRHSDLVDRSDGVLYTSDGRDVEMSVASTKAFYAQVAAGFLLAHAVADELRAGGAAGIEPGAEPDADADVLLRALRELPTAMEEVLARRAEIALAAQRQAPRRRYWAVVGNGANRIAAHEVRIKLSELCYKSIACDGTEDKKHIDLSAEPLILVCAAGLTGSNADDVAKELAIYRAHKAAPIAIVSDDDGRFGAAIEVLSVPSVHPALGFVLAAMVGHLFGYEAALAIDGSARPLREARAAIEELATAPGTLDALDALAERLEGPSERFFAGLRDGSYDGTLEAATAVRIASLFRYATGVFPLDAFQVEHGRVGTPATVVEDLTAALTAGIEELTRPVDAIKHQAKTVTVGISRSDETLLLVPLVQEVLAAGAARDSLSYRVLRTLVDLDAAVRSVLGFTRYRVDGDPETDDATVGVADRGGSSVGIRSRTDTDPRLRGTKQTVAAEQDVFVTQGRADGRVLAFVPEVKGGQTVGITLLHLELEDRLTPDVARGVLSGYRHRYTALRGAVTETEDTFDDARLAEIPVLDLLTSPISPLADRWR